MPNIHPTAIVDPKAEIAADVIIGPYCTVGSQVSIGAGTKLISHVVLAGKLTLGENNQLFPFVSLGQVPQDLKFDGETTEVIIGDNNSIREHVTISLGTKGGGGVTRIGNNNLLMALAHVGHDSQVGNHCVLANGATLAGHVDVEDYAIVGGLSAVHQFTRVGQHAIVGGMTPVARDVMPYCMVSGTNGALQGLNLVGLRRRGFEKESIKALRESFGHIFLGTEGSVKERVEKMAKQFAHILEVQNWNEFVQKSERGLCLPKESSKNDA